MADQIMALGQGYDDPLERILKRPCDISWLANDRFERSVSRTSDYKPSDTRWLSSEHLTEPWTMEEKWWLSRTNDTFLDTNSRVFGRKKVYLVDKKVLKSENDICTPKVEEVRNKIVRSTPIV